MLLLAFCVLQSHIHSFIDVLCECNRFLIASTEWNQCWNITLLYFAWVGVCFSCWNCCSLSLWFQFFTATRYSSHTFKSHTHFSFILSLNELLRSTVSHERCFVHTPSHTQRTNSLSHLSLCRACAVMHCFCFNTVNLFSRFRAWLSLTHISCVAWRKLFLITLSLSLSLYLVWTQDLKFSAFYALESKFCSLDCSHRMWQPCFISVSLFHTL